MDAYYLDSCEEFQHKTKLNHVIYTIKVPQKGFIYKHAVR